MFFWKTRLVTGSGWALFYALFGWFGRVSFLFLYAGPDAPERPPPAR